MFNQKTMLLLCWMGFYWIIFLKNGYSQQYRTDVLFMQQRELTKLRLRQEQEKNSYQYAHKSEDFQEFLGNQSTKNTRLQYEEAKLLSNNRNALNEHKKNWAAYLAKKKQEETLLRKLRDDRNKKPQSSLQKKAQQDFLNNEKRKQTLLQQQLAGKQAKKSALKNQREKYENFVALKKNQLKKISTKTTTAQHSSAKQEEFNRFLKARQKAFREEKAEQSQTNLSQKANEYAEFIAEQKKRESLLQGANLGKAKLGQKQIQAKQKQYNDFVKNRRKARMAIQNGGGLTQTEAYQQRMQSKGKEFEQFMENRKKQNAVTQ